MSAGQRLRVCLVLLALFIWLLYEDGTAVPDWVLVTALVILSPLVLCGLFLVLVFIVSGGRVPCRHCRGGCERCR